jgi:hypothetical protein
MKEKKLTKIIGTVLLGSGILLTGNYMHKKLIGNGEYLPTKPNSRTEWILERNSSSEESTRGNLYNDKNLNGIVDEGDTHLTETLELNWRDNRRNISCIPEGNYEIRKRKSKKFDYHFTVKDVPNRSYILLHPGTKPTQSKGCILLVGKENLNGRDLLDNLLEEFGSNKIKMKISSPKR